MTTTTESRRQLGCAGEVKCLLDLIDQCTQTAFQQAHGQVSLEPESVSLALDLTVAAVERIRTVLTQAPPPESPPGPPEPEPVEASALEAPEHEVRSR